MQFFYLPERRIHCVYASHIKCKVQNRIVFNPQVCISIGLRIVLTDRHRIPKSRNTYMYIGNFI